MPVARRSAPRRRVFRTRAKYDYQVTTRRFKRLLPIMWPELEWELDVLLRLEQDCFTLLNSLGVPTDQWDYYVGFTKKIWERRIDFADSTYQLEKQSLHNEYELRGLQSSILDQCQPIGEQYALLKKGIPPAPPITLEEAGMLIYGLTLSEWGMLIYGEIAYWVLEAGMAAYGDTWFEGGMLVRS